jgi:membrane protease subunit HflK
VGAASRLAQEAEGYKARIVAQAQGDGQRFKLLLTEYQRAPQVTRDRLYLESMQQIYSNVTKVMVETRQGGNNMLFLPLDRILQQVSAGGVAAPQDTPAPAQVPPGTAPSTSSSAAADARNRENARGRERETR